MFKFHFIGLLKKQIKIHYFYAQILDIIIFRTIVRMSVPYPVIFKKKIRDKPTLFTLFSLFALTYIYRKRIKWLDV